MSRSRRTGCGRRTTVQAAVGSAPPQEVAEQQQTVGVAAAEEVQTDSRLPPLSPERWPPLAVLAVGSNHLAVVHTAVVDRLELVDTAVSFLPEHMEAGWWS